MVITATMGITYQHEEDGHNGGDADYISARTLTLVIASVITSIIIDILASIMVASFYCHNSHDARRVSKGPAEHT